MKRLLALFLSASLLAAPSTPINNAVLQGTLTLSQTSTVGYIPLANIGGFPSPVGQSGLVLGSDGTGLVWVTGGGGGGTVTSITAGTGLSGGTITTFGTIALANTAVTAGSYTSANITVDAQGRLTAAANGSGGGGSGTVTSVGVTTANGVSATGGPITTSGNFTFTLGAITPSTVNGLTFLANATGFQISGGTASRTLIVSGNATVSGTNTGDQTITLTGDVTGSGTGSFATTLANSGVTAGTYGSASVVPVTTFDAKGRSTGTTNTTISITPSQAGLGSITNDAQTKAAIVPNTLPTAGQLLVGNAGGTAYAPVSASGDLTVASTGAHTLNTVNSNVGTFGNGTTVPQVTVNAKGLVTAVTNVTITATGNITGTQVNGNITVGTGANSVAASNITVSGNSTTFPGSISASSVTIPLIDSGSSALTIKRNTGSSNTAIILTDSTNTAASRLQTSGSNFIVAEPAGVTPWMTLTSTSGVWSGSLSTPKASSSAGYLFGNSSNQAIIYADSFDGNAYSNIMSFRVSDSTSSGAWVWRGATSSTTWMQLYSGLSGGLFISATNVASSFSVASLATLGGVYIGKNEIIASTTDATAINTGALAGIGFGFSGTSTGPSFVGGNFTAGGNVTGNRISGNLTGSTGYPVGNIVGTVGVAQGGTAAVTLTANNIITGNGTGAVTFIAPGTIGNVVTSNGSAWISSAPAGGGNVTGGSLTANAIVVGTSGTGITVLSSLGSSGQLLRSASAGTPPIWSTPTFPNTATANKILVGDGTNIVLSTPTFPNASATANKIIISDGTNWIASTATYAVPGTSGNVLTSDGTNWTSAAAAGGSLTATYVAYGNATNVPTGEAAFAYSASTNILTVGGISLGAGSEVSSIGPLVDAVDGTTPLNNIIETVASGTAYTLTTSYAALDFGTTDPVITIANAGTYTLYFDVQTALVSATTTTQSVQFKLRRTNNTAADLGTIISQPLPVATIGTEGGPSVAKVAVKYSTVNTNDSITIYGQISASLGAGTATVSDAHITAIRAY